VFDVDAFTLRLRSIAPLEVVAKALETEVARHRHALSEAIQRDFKDYILFSGSLAPVETSIARLRAALLPLQARLRAVRDETQHYRSGLEQVRYKHIYIYISPSFLRPNSYHKGGMGVNKGVLTFFSLSRTYVRKEESPILSSRLLGGTTTRTPHLDEEFTLSALLSTDPR
jgi:hypothetical protein